MALGEMTTFDPGNMGAGGGAAGGGMASFLSIIGPARQRMGQDAQAQEQNPPAPATAPRAIRGQGQGWLDDDWV